MNQLPKILCKHKCKEVIECNYGLMGNRVSKKPILFVLNYPDKRILQSSLFENSYLTALKKTRTGMILKEMLDYCQFNLEDITLTNFFKGIYLINKKPSTKDFKKCFSVLEKQIQQISPSKIIFFGNDAKRVIKKEFEASTLYFIHPSAIWARTIIPEKRIPYYKKIKEFLKSD